MPPEPVLLCRFESLCARAVVCASGGYWALLNRLRDGEPPGLPDTFSAVFRDFIAQTLIKVCGCVRLCALASPRASLTPTSPKRAAGWRCDCVGPHSAAIGAGPAEGAYSVCLCVAAFHFVSSCSPPAVFPVGSRYPRARRTPYALVALLWLPFSVSQHPFVVGCEPGVDAGGATEVRGPSRQSVCMCLLVLAGRWRMCLPAASRRRPDSLLLCCSSLHAGGAHPGHAWRPD